MKVFLLISLLLSLYYCGDVSAYVASNTSVSVSDGTQLVKHLSDMKGDLEKLVQDRRKYKDTKDRVRRYSESSGHGLSDILDRGFSGFRSVWKSYIVQPLFHGNFKETPIRLMSLWLSDYGRFIFGSLDKEPNQSFKSLMKSRRTGDIIACKIPGNKLAEHYMMILKERQVADNIVEVSVVGGKKSTSNNGLMESISFKNSSYYNSDECLKHENRIILTAGKIDAANGGQEETDAKIDEIIERLSATANKLSESTTHRFDYDLLSCNCQDFVLYWSYGYVEHNSCIVQLFSDGKIPHRHGLQDLFNYIDRDGSARKSIEAKERAREAPYVEQSRMMG